MQAQTQPISKKTQKKIAKKAKKVAKKIAKKVASQNGASAKAKEPVAKERTYRSGEKIELPRISVKRFKVRVVGDTPLICHKWSSKALTEMRDKQQGKAKMKKKPKDPNAEFNGARYLDAKGRDCVKANFFKQALVSSSRFLGKESPMTKIRGAVFIEGDMIPIDFKGKEPIMREDTADLRYRPEYQDWSCELDITYNSDVFTAEQVLNFLQVAGYGVGICEWRPECNGGYGRFRIEEARAA
jgi:hypothetical protein